MITSLVDSRINKSKTKKKTLVSYIAVFLIVPTIILIMFITLNKTGTSLDTGDTIKAEKTYQTKDRLTFTLDLSNNPSLTMNTYIKLASLVYAQEQLPNTYQEENLTISANLVNEVTNEVVDIPLKIQKESPEKYIISSQEETYNIVPGKYALEVDVTNDNNTQTFTQDFTWGVLAINTNKSIYGPYEKSTIAMAVLDEAGEMVCNADVYLKITDPNNKETPLSTKDTSIRISPNCSKKEYIPTPDYEAYYTTNLAGEYKMELLAVTPNGSYSIEDSFEVRDYVPFDIERKTATRIFPPVNYPVTIIIKANEDFSGIIQETVPKDFDILSNHEGEIIREFGNPNTEFGLVQRAEYYAKNDTAIIETTDNIKTINWQVNLKKGQEYQLEYIYAAPQISPEFYLLGPLKLISNSGSKDNVDNIDSSEVTTNYKNENAINVIFSELRHWQIAADAISYQEANSTGSANATSISTSLTAAANSLVVFSCNVAANVTVTGPSGYTTVYNTTGTGLSHGTFFKISAGATESPSCTWTGSNTATALILEYTGTETTTGQILDTSDADTGSGDSSVECPSVSPSAGNHLYVATVSLDDDVSISTWTNTFSERVDYNYSSGPPGGRHAIAAADKITTGSQSTTATAGGTVAWDCHMAAFNEDVDWWYGRVFTDDDEGTSLNSQSVCGVVNAGTPSCTTTDGSGYFLIATLDAVSGDELTFFLDGGTNFGNTKTVTDGGDIITADSLRIYQNHVVLRHDQGSSITIDQIKQYDNADNPTDMLYTVTDATPDLLSVETPNELFVQSGYTFAPTGNVTAVHDIEIDGVWTAAASQTVSLSGTYKLDSGGTLNPSTSTITFSGTGGTEDIITTGTGGPYNLVLNDSGGSLTVEAEDALKVYNNLTITGGTLDAKSGENNQINVGGNWDNDDIFLPRTGTVVMDGSGATTYTMDTDGSTSDDYFYNLTFNDASGGATYQLSNLLDVNHDITITGGALNSNGNDITVGGSWTNDDIFTEGTGTVTFDTGYSATIDSGCADPSSCTNENFYNLVINKSAGPGDVTLANTGLRVTNSTTITQGVLNQGTLNVQLEGTTALTVEDQGHWYNISTGDITLGGNVVNRGAITLNSNGVSCGDADSITIASTASTSREWSGNGAFRITDVTVSWQSGSAIIYTASSTSSGNMGANWIFTDCSILNIEGIDFEGVNID